jgi:hypothetical protein
MTKNLSNKGNAARARVLFFLCPKLKSVFNFRERRIDEKLRLVKLVSNELLGAALRGLPLEVLLTNKGQPQRAAPTI